MKDKLIKENNFSYYVDRLLKAERINDHPRFSKFMEMAKTLSEESKFDTYKIGALIAIKGKVISRGANSYKTHPQQKRYNRERMCFTEEAKPFIHAEMAALQKLKGIKSENLKNAEMYVYRTGLDGSNRMCRPCAACMKAIKDHGISVIHYTTTQGIATEYLDKNLPTDVKKAKKLI